MIMMIFVSLHPCYQALTARFSVCSFGFSHFAIFATYVFTATFTITIFSCESGEN